MDPKFKEVVSLINNNSIKIVSKCHLLKSLISFQMFQCSNRSSKDRNKEHNR